MGLLNNTSALEGIKKYLDATDFTDNEIGHQLAMSFFPEDTPERAFKSRYTMTLNSGIFSKKFENATAGGIIVDAVNTFNENIEDKYDSEMVELYKELGYIVDGRFTKEMIATELSNSVAISVEVNTDGNKEIVKSDYLGDALQEFSYENLIHFLEQVDSYIPQ